MSKKTKTIQEVGEFGLIERIKTILKPESPDIILGLGDDAAVIRSRNAPIVYTTDTMVEGTHFHLNWHSPEELAHKALASNMSDLAAKCAEPAFFLITLGLYGDMEIEWVERFYQTLERLKNEWTIQAVGGDTIFSPQCIISITAWGYQRTNDPVTNSGAKPGDSIFVTGTLGDAAAGLEMFMNEKEKMNDYSFLKERFSLPLPRWKEALYLADYAKIHCMTDLSDGLARDLPKICRASQCGAWIEGQKLPCSSELKKYAGDRFIEYAWKGGEDYELLFSLSKEDGEKLIADWPFVTCNLTHIGEMIPAKDGLHIEGVSSSQLSGFDHFHP